MDEPRHKGTINSAIDHYEITGIDRPTGKVLVNFAYKGHGLHHTVMVENVEDSAAILQAVQAHYEQYKQDVEKARARRVPLPDDVQGLIGHKNPL